MSSIDFADFAFAITLVTFATAAFFCFFSSLLYGKERLSLWDARVVHEGCGNVRVFVPNRSASSPSSGTSVLSSRMG